MKSAGLVISIFALFAGVLNAQAEADGPDFFRVEGVRAGDVLNIRAAPSATAAKLGGIPPRANGVKNLGCRGGLTFAQWQKAGQAEREAAQKTRWCRISWQGVEGWVAARYLREGSAR